VNAQPPADTVANEVVTLAMQRYSLEGWARRAEAIGRKLGPTAIPDLLATMVHPPKVVWKEGGWNPMPWTWVYRVQIAAAMIVAHTETAWEGSARRAALSSLVWGPMDWTTDASLMALAALARREEALADDIAGIFRARYASRPRGAAACWAAPILWLMQRLPNLESSERTELRARLRERYEVDEDDQADTDFKLAQIHHKDNDIPKALEALGKALAARPDHAPALELRGEIYIDTDDYPKALADFDALARVQPDNPYAHLQRGQSLRLMNRPAEAIPAYDEAIRLKPGVAVAHKLRGLAWLDQSNVAKAEADFDQATQLDANNPQHWYLRGRSRRMLGRNADSLADLTQALELNPNYRFAFQERGNTYVALRDRPRAIADFSAALAIQPSAYVFNRRAMCHNLEGNYAQSLADHLEAHKLDPSDADTCNYVAWVLAASPVDGVRDGKRAVEFAQKACELCKWSEAGIVDTLAVALAECGDFARAIEIGEKVLAMAEPGDRPKYEARVAQYRAGRPVRAD
jgi:tetratricopeptide (TPR) repeat protein